MAAIAACGDNGVVPVDAPVDEPLGDAVLSITPLQNDFASVTLGETSNTATFVVTNTGESPSGDISALATGTNAGEFNITDGCSTLDAGGTCNVTVTFSPTTAGTKMASLVVSGSPGGSVSANLLGIGVAPGALTITQSNTALGTVVVGQTSAGVATFVVRNTGGIDAESLTVTSAGTDPGEFTKVTDECDGQDLAPDATCSITVSFTPLTTGAKAASFIITGNPGGTVSGAVTGTGVAPALIEVTPSIQPYGTVVVGQASGSQTFVVRNTGGVAAEALSAPVLSGADNSQFEITLQNCAGAILQANGANSCSVGVRFRPTTAAPADKVASLDLAAGALTANAILSGTAVTAGSLSIDPSGTFAFSPPSIEVGQVSASQIFTITNTGAAATSALNTSIGGAHNGDFRIVAGADGCDGVPLAGGASCEVTLEFAPTAGGLRTANLTVSHTGTPVVVTLSGVGVSPADLDICNGTSPCLVNSIASRDFGSVVTGQSSTAQSFTITNNGGSTTSNITEAINGTNASQFSLVGDCSTLDPGESCTVQVTYNAQTVGPVSAVLDFTAAQGGTASAALSGNGIAAAQISVTPTTITFVGNGFNGSTTVGDSTGPNAATSFTVTNNGTQTTGDITVTPIGPNAADFTVTENCTVLIANAQCTVNVTFSPTAPGLRQATIEVTAAGAGGTAGVAVQGDALPRLEIIDTNGTSPPANPYTFPTSVFDPDAPSTVTVTVRNNRNVATTLGFVENDPGAGNFDLGTNGCAAGTILDPGETCQYVVAFDPQELGLTEATFTVRVGASTAANDQATETLRGTASNLTFAMTDNFDVTLNSVILGTSLTIDQAPDATPTSHDFGDQELQSASAVRYFRVTNTGGTETGRITVNLTGDVSDFQITTNSCASSDDAIPTENIGGSLGDNEACYIGVTFNPRSTGMASATLTVRATQMTALGGTVTATLSGNGIAQGEIFTPGLLDFGSVFAGSSADLVVTITNPHDNTTTLSASAVGFSGFNLTNGFSRVAGPAGGLPDCGGSTAGAASVAVGTLLTGTLQADSSCEVWFRFNSSLVVGGEVGTIRLQESLGGQSRLITLTGTTQSTLRITSAAPTFTDVVVNSVPAPSFAVTLINDSASTVSVPAGSITVSPFAGSYNVLNNTCGSVAGGATCGFNLVFNPTTPGNFNTTLTVSGNTGAVQTASATQQVTANAVSAANITLNPTGLDSGTTYNFGTALAGQTPPVGATRTFRFQNLRTAAPNGQDSTGALTVAIASATGDAGDFVITAGGDGCTGNSLAADGFCDVTVQYAPVAAESGDTATLTVTGVRGGSATATLNGSSTALGTVTVTPSAYMFPPTVQNCATIVPSTCPTQDFIVQNTSSMSAATLTLTVTGTNGPAFTFVTPSGSPLPQCTAGMSLAAGTSCVARIQYSSANLAPALKVAQLNVVGGSVIVPLRAITLAPPNISVNTTNVAFGIQTEDSDSPVQLITLTNNGGVASGPVTVATGGTDLAHFDITSTDCVGNSLDAGESCSIVAVFSPTETGAKAATITVGATQAPVADFGPTVINLSGTGVTPAQLSLTPNPGPTGETRAMGQLDTTFDRYEIRNNTGTFQSGAISLTFGGMHPDDFAFVTAGVPASGTAANPCDAATLAAGLAPGAGCYFGVFFNPTDAGTRSATIIAQATPGGTTTTTTSGIGTEALIYGPGVAVGPGFATPCGASPCDFGSGVPGDAGTAHTLTFRNDADVATTLLELDVTDMDNFVIITDNCTGRSLAADNGNNFVANDFAAPWFPNGFSEFDQCQIQFQFIPQGETAGMRSNTVTLRTTVNGVETTSTVVLQGIVN